MLKRYSHPLPYSQARSLSESFAFLFRPVAQDSLYHNGRTVFVAMKFGPASDLEADSMVDPTDQRKSSRYELGAVVSFLWKDLQGNHHAGAGYMRDVSVRGLFVITPMPPPIGTKVRLEICFESSLTDSPIEIQAKGQVCRVEPDNQNGEHRGFAASTKRFKLQRHGRQLDMDNIF
jgi:hypothetical protein